jgi:hypothetical protein
MSEPLFVPTESAFHLTLSDNTRHPCPTANDNLKIFDLFDVFHPGASA